MKRVLLLALFAGGCGGAAWKSAPHDRYFQSVPPPKLHARLPARATSAWWDSIVHSTLRPLGQVLSPGHHLHAPAALDVNAFGQVLDSTWFTNRISRGGFTREQAARGPNQLSGPAPGPLQVIGGKVEGATPGLVIEDSAGNVFIVKFDPPAFPEMASSAEVIAAKLLHAAGYYVPENYIAEVELGRFFLSRDAKARGEYEGEQVALTPEKFWEIVIHANPFQDGRIRALFSRRIPGTILGHFDYRTVREDDPNDVIPHDRRRSLRALWMFSAWLHNSDTTALNTLDSFIEAEPGVGYVRHYLIDFGDALGASGTKPKHPGQGYEGDLDWLLVGGRLFSLGIVYPYWLPARRSPFRSVGIFEGDVFDPVWWRPEVPNPAFDASTVLDDYWAASIIARFTPELLAAIVGEAKYSEPGAAEWVLRVLSERQYKLLEHAFARVLPLEDPIVRGARLEMTDLAVAASMMMSPEDVSYRFAVHWDEVELERGTAREPAVDLGAAIARARGAAFEEDPFITVSWWRAEEDSPRTDVHLRVAGAEMFPVAIDREVR